MTAATPEPSSRRRLPWVGVVATGLIALQVLLRGTWIWQSWFLIDDYLFMGDIARGVDDAEWYLQLHRGHFMPLSFGLVKVVMEFGSPFDWTAPAVQIITLQAIASLACWWMLQSVFGSRRAILVPLAIYLFSPLTMPTIMWWAVAINQLPHQIAFFGIIGSHVRYCRTRRRRWLLLSSLFLVVGYASYAKTPLIVISVALLTWIWFSWGEPWGRFWRTIRTFRWAWIVYGGISLAWAAIYLTRPSNEPQGAPTDLLVLAESMVLRSFVPTLAGGPWDWVLFDRGPISYTSTPVVGVVVSTVLLTGTVAFAAATRDRALRMLVPVVVYLAGSLILVSTGRSYVLTILGGQFVGEHLQYISDIAPLLTVCLAGLFLPVIGASEPVRRRDAPLWRGRFPRWPAVLVGVGFVAGSLWSSASYAHEYADFPERRATERGVETLTSQNPTLVSGFVPSRILPPLFGERALTENFFAPVGDSFTVRDRGLDLQAFDEQVNLVDAGVRDPAATTEVAAPVPTTARCREVDRFETFDVAIPPAFGLWLAVDVRVTSAPGYVYLTSGSRTMVERVPLGTHRLLLATPEPSPEVQIRTTDGLELCVTAIRYGYLAPEAGR